MDKHNNTLQAASRALDRATRLEDDTWAVYTTARLLKGESHIDVKELRSLYQSAKNSRKAAFEVYMGVSNLFSMAAKNYLDKIKK